ncbi:MAG: TIGR00366 family protein [Synergistaceae bacterium]|jgi:uncharacterized ion transporter superfamily protein YfcC|nr:TIGR00366 family protein [Synergistaceae bacterium]
MHVDDEAHITGIPHVYTILFLIIILSALATWVTPAGQYSRSAAGEITPGTYRETEPKPMGPMTTLSTVYRGMVKSADTVFFIFITFASISVVVSTGVFQALISRILDLFKGHSRILIIPIFILLIGIASSTMAVFEEMFPFVSIFVAVAAAMKYDALVGMSIVALGIGLGYSGACLNPFTVGIAQGIAGLPPFSGAAYRIFCHLLMVLIASIYVMLYAYRVSRNPESSMIRRKNLWESYMDKKVLEKHPLNARHFTVLMLILAGITTIIWGVSRRMWYFEQLSAVYLVMGIGSGVIMGWSPDKISHKWAEGAVEITSTCLKIAFARGILLILEDSNILDTLIYWLSMPLERMPRWVAAESMLIVQTVINFFVPSGSGQAVVSMPLMVPLSDLLGISRQTAVLIFQFGDGISNVIWLTGSMPILCKFAKIPPRLWLRWFTPLFLIIVLTQMFCIAVALAINY